MNLNNKEKIIFLVLVLSLSFSLFSLVDYIRLSFNIENNRDGMTGGTEPPPPPGTEPQLPPAFDPNNAKSDEIGTTIYGVKLWDNTYRTPEERQSDLDPNCSYENQLRGAERFTRKGSWEALETNMGAFKDQTTGLTTNDYKVSKTRNGIGISLPIWTNEKCSNFEDEDIYTMNYTLSNEKNGLIGNLINSLSETGQALQDFSTDNQDDPCVPKQVKIVTCSSKEGTGNVYLKKSEVDKFSTSDNSPIEAFKNIDELLANDKLFYKDYFIFIYFFMLTLLFLYYILIIVINNN